MRKAENATDFTDSERWGFACISEIRNVFLLDAQIFEQFLIRLCRTQAHEKIYLMSYRPQLCNPEKEPAVPGAIWPATPYKNWSYVVGDSGLGRRCAARASALHYLVIRPILIWFSSELWILALNSVLAT